MGGSTMNRGTTIMKRSLLTTLLVTLLAPLAGASAQEEPELNVLMQALRDELTRSTEELEMEGLEKPYFIAYTVRETERLEARASFGALLSSTQNKSRRLSVEVRVGDPSFDNTNFGSMSILPSSFGPGGALPLENDYREFRRQIWLATDAAYKSALEMLAERRALLQNETRAEDLADFTPVEPFSFYGDAGPDLPPRPALDDLVRGLSEQFKRMPDIFESEVVAAVRNQRTYYLNSEGSAFIRSDPSASIRIEAHTQAGDGTVLDDSVATYGDSWAEVGDLQALQAHVEAIGRNLTARRSAATIDRYNGPVLFEGQAAAELFTQVFMPRLLGNRVPDAEPRLARMLQQARNPFLDRIGGRVLPRSLSIQDDPTLDADGFLGGYAVDDDGVEARAKVLVENGVLRTLLTTRNPVPGIDRSTGNRRGEGPLPSNVLLTSNRAMTRDELRAEFMQLIEERGAGYGIVVRRMAGRDDGDAQSRMSFLLSGPEAAPSIGSLIAVYKVLPDGTEELIPKAEVAGVTEAAFRDIVEVSDTSTVYSLPQSASGGSLPAFLLAALSMDQVVTVSVPDLLFEELTVRKPSGNAPHLPVANHPYFDR